MKVVIAGGTGQIGQMLKRQYLKRGYEVVVLTRSPRNKQDIHWDGQNLGPWAAELDGADWLINLAGRTVNCRYTKKNLKQMMDSRLESTEVLGKAIEACQKPPKVWFQMSTATIYAHTFDKANDEFTGTIGGDEPGAPEYWNYSIDIAKNWEKVLDEANTPNTRKVALRAAMVMSPDKGGVFQELSRLAILGLGGAIAGGKQYMSWIHEDDFVGALDFINEKKVTGAINLSSPEPLTQKEFMKELRQQVGHPIGLPATKWMAEIGAWFLRTDTELVLKSRRVTPGRLLKEGFDFKFKTWQDAADDLTTRSGKKLTCHFFSYASIAFIFSIALFASLSFLDGRPLRAVMLFGNFFFALIAPFLLSLWLVRQTIGRKLYTKKDTPQKLGHSLLWSYVSAIAVVYSTWMIASFSTFFFQDSFFNISSGTDILKRLWEYNFYAIFVFIFTLPGIAIFGTLMGLDIHKKLYGRQAYQR